MKVREILLLIITSGKTTKHGTSFFAFEKTRGKNRVSLLFFFLCLKILLAYSSYIRLSDLLDLP